VTSVPTATTFTYTNPVAGLGASTVAGTATPITTGTNIAAALAAIPALGANVTVAPVAASTVNNEYFTVTFGGTLAGAAQPTMTVGNTALVASANVVRLSVATTTAGTTALTINPGGTVELDNTAVNNTNRVND